MKDDRAFKDSVRGFVPGAMLRRVKLSVTVDQETEEKLWLLASAKYGTRKTNVSRIINIALLEYFNDPEIAAEVEEAYRKWKLKSR